PRIYPPPPTGHELMKLFPPLPPDHFSALKPGPTSIFFHRQERQFFAQAGKEIIRVRVESDFPPPDRAPMGEQQQQPPAPRGKGKDAAWAQQLPPPPHAYEQHPRSDEDGDEAWRRPMPHAERRRAGKHTKRMVVK
ncbi:hypothetical protein FA95DRAFT_1479409, partial [Auriscalpium vulgare]